MLDLAEKRSERPVLTPLYQGNMLDLSDVELSWFGDLLFESICAMEVENWYRSVLLSLLPALRPKTVVYLWCALRYKIDEVFQAIASWKCTENTAMVPGFLCGRTASFHRAWAAYNFCPRRGWAFPRAMMRCMRSGPEDSDLWYLTRAGYGFKRMSGLCGLWGTREPAFKSARWFFVAEKWDKRWLLVLSQGLIFSQRAKPLLEQATILKIIAMSRPNFVPWEPAIVDKWTRAQMALEAGADLVLEVAFLSQRSRRQTFSWGAQ